jgi:hypothetical protein
MYVHHKKHFKSMNLFSIIKVLFIHQLMHKWVVLKMTLNLKIYIKTAGAVLI